MLSPPPNPDQASSGHPGSHLGLASSFWSPLGPFFFLQLETHVPCYLSPVARQTLCRNVPPAPHWYPLRWFSSQWERSPFIRSGSVLALGLCTCCHLCLNCYLFFFFCHFFQEAFLVLLESIVH